MIVGGDRTSTRRRIVTLINFNSWFVGVLATPAIYRVTTYLKICGINMSQEEWEYRWESERICWISESNITELRLFFNFVQHFTANK